MSTNADSIARTPAGDDPHVAAIDPAQLPQLLLERRAASLRFRVVRGQIYKDADPPHPLWLLRAEWQGPRGCTAEERDESPSLYARHGDFLPCVVRCRHPPAGSGFTLVLMHAELTHGGRQLLAADLNCPESRARVVACV